MDLLKSTEAQAYAKGGLHLSRAPQIVNVPTGRPLFEKVDARNRSLIDDFASRRGSRRQSSVQGDAFAALPRFYNPTDYYKYNHVPYNINDDKERAELYRWLDFFYRTHYLVPILVDIFTRFPLVGIEFHNKDKQIREFHEDLFFDRLDYEHFLVDLGREYWTLGESFPLGHFNETLGIWEEEELLDPTAIKVRRYPIIGGEQLFLVPDPELKKIVETKAPKEMYYLLERDYPELLPFFKNGKDIPISNVLLKQVAFKASTRDLHGTPILLRAMRTLIHEEKLMASQDAIAERLYSPLILAKLGIQDMGPNRPPWIPTPGDIQNMRNELDLALSADFRLMVHHFGIEVQNVFGREQMPRLDQDFDRIETRLMQTFGINPSLLSGGSASQPYASSALQAEFLNQILRTYQGYLIKHWKSRALVVAEAQQHWEYEKRGDTRIPIKEEVLVRDQETGEERIVERNKLLIPEMRMKVLDLRDEATQRQFMQALKQQGVPMPDGWIAMGMHYDFEEALITTQEEMIQKTITTQEAKVKTYDILTAKGLPIPQDLKAEVEGQLAGGEGDMGGGMPGGKPGGPGGMGGDSIAMPPPPGGTPAIGPRNPTRGQRPEESDERSPIPPPGQVPTGPTLPGVPGQPGMMGIPGAPTPAIGTPPRGSSVNGNSESISDESITLTLPRKKADNYNIEKLHIFDDSATLNEDEREESET